MEAAEIPIHSSAKSMAPTAISLGNVLASARSLYGNPWLSILRRPRQSAGLFVYFTPDEFGLAYSFHVFATTECDYGGGYIGEPTVLAGELTHRGVTDEYWCAFTQDYRPSIPGVLNGVFSALEGFIR